MAQSHKFCDHPPTKAARAKCRRERAATGQDYQGGWSYDYDGKSETRCRTCRGKDNFHFSWCPYYVQMHTRSRTRDYPRHDCCGAYQAAGHKVTCRNYIPPQGWSDYRGSGWDPFSDLFGPRNDRVVANANGGYRQRDQGRGRFNDAADDKARSPIQRRIVQLERQAEYVQGPERDSFLSAARRLRQANGLIGQVL